MPVPETILTEFIKGLFSADFWSKLFKKNKEKNRGATEALLDFIRIGAIAKDVCESDLAVDSFLLMMAHNSGRKMSPHNFKYRSITGGYFISWMLKKLDIDNYKYLDIDYEYADLLVKISEYKEVDIRAEDLGKTKLGHKFRYEGYRFVKYIFLKQDQYGIWYVMIGTTQEGESFSTDNHMQCFNLAVNKIRNIIRRY